MIDLSFLVDNKNFFLISGPCVIEEPDIMKKTVETLLALTTRFNIPFVFKSSYLKANRTSGDSYAGPGLEKGLAILAEIKREYKVPILTDIHEIQDIEAAAEVADILQIPAFLCRQTYLLFAAAKTGRIVNIKKGQFLAAEDIGEAVKKVVSCGNKQILLTERGVSFGYHNLVVDFRNFPIMKEFGYPVIYDVTHSLQQPSLGKTSGGTPQYVPMMAKAAIATGMVDGLFLETHPDPEKGKSDAKSMIQLDKVGRILEECLKIQNCLCQ